VPGAGEVDQAGCAALGKLDQPRRQVAGVGRAADLVGDDRELLAGAGGEPQHRRHEVVPAGAKQPGGANDRVLG